VVAAGGRSSPESREALAELCRTYWYPLYAYVRSHGRRAHDAEDVTQEFFATLLEKGYLQAADRRRGRFRSFLLTAFKRFLAKARDRDAAQKRGGGNTVLSIDFEAGEGRFKREPSHDWTPDRVFDRRWALTMLEHVLARLGGEYTGKQRERLWQHLQPYLAGSSRTPPYATVAAELGMSEGAIKVAVHRLRQRYRELLRDEITQTVDSPDDVDDELTFLLAALRGGKS
jgi:RNA polymerase sigma-70 factor (ECF subfamily)